MENIRIMSQNLLGSDTEYPNHAKNPKFSNRIKVDLTEHTMEKRLPRVISLIEKYSPDSVGVQECCTTWRSLFANGSLDEIGYVRLGATKHPKSSIIYNAKKLELIESESIWLTEKPEELSLSVEWRESPDDPLIERLAMYAVFEIRESGERYIHFNTHIDIARNSMIQVKQTELLLSYIENIRAKHGNLPAVLTGDFNFNPEAPAYAIITSSDVVRDTRTECNVSEGISSFNKFIGPDYAPLPIDYVFGTKNLIFRSHKVIQDTIDGHFVSDHYAVCADFTLN